MMLIPIFITCFAIFGGIMIGIYIIKYRKLPIDVWKPGAAWTRALIYFSFCNIFTAASGTLEQIFSRPLFTAEQISNLFWIFYVIFCFIFVFIAYVIIWPRSTLNFDRRYYLGSEIVFGVIWGFSTGGILLSFYHLWSLTGIPPLVTFILSFSCIGVWQYFIQAYFWDIYVSPEHDTPKSILIKTFACHIPNALISLSFLAIWGNYAIFIFIFIIALLASTIGQRFPAPWAKGNFHAPMFKSGIFGLPIGSGYEEKK
ncbi:MAG: hypothetical protein E3J90_11050 [Promethearchaeota archaeon]|nr:MAG: hypothetical protein E3J90_11050 [Candidatus Lokiarchaeota archaeon]